METWGGLNVQASPLLKDGTFVWLKGREVLDIVTADRVTFLSMFGLTLRPPAGTDGVVISLGDLLVLEARARGESPSEEKK